MNLEKLKDSARKFEQKEDWRRAIEVYLRAIEQIESGVETSPDLSLYNRVGDLHLKTNDTAAAVRSYERAVDLYADQGFFNNAIALCGKILRVNPGRTQTYLKLAQLHARKNVVIEAKRNLIEFLERMNALGQLDQAFTSIKEFADQFSGSQEIRTMLVDLLRAASRDEDARQLESHADRDGHRPVAATPEAAADHRPAARPLPRAAGLVFLDTGLDVPTAPARPSAEPVEAVGEVAPPDGLMVTEPVEPDESAAPGMIIEPLTEVPADDLPPLPGLEQTADAGLGTVELGLDQTIVSDDLLDVSDEDLMVPLDAGEAPAGSTDLPLIEFEQPADEIGELEGRVLEDPDDPELHRQLAEALLASGDEFRGLEEMELALAGHEAREEWDLASELSGGLVRLAPDNIRYHQKRVELAYRTGDRAPLLEAYLALGDALARGGAKEKALAVYGRVREHDPENAHAAAAVEALEAVGPRRPAPPAVYSSTESAPAPAAAPAQAAASAAPLPPSPPRAPSAGDAFVDLGSMVLDEEGPRDTRMRIDRRDPQDEDEQREFREILEQFKRGIEENLDTDDYQAHYDLGVAFKEMGLLDEAIAEFQKALRAPEGRLRTSEALGICFFEKGQHAIAETVLRRAVETIEGGDEAKIGLLYWLGRASESQGKDTDAIGSYERALAVDIRFMDLSERIQRLTAGRRE